MRDAYQILVAGLGFVVGATFIWVVVRWFSPRYNSGDGSPLGRWVLYNFARSFRGTRYQLVPPQQKPLYYVALALTGVGLVLVLSPFARLLANLGNEGHFEGTVGDEVFRGFGGLVLTIVGRFLMNLAARGWRNVGIVPEPESTRRKLVASVHSGEGLVSTVPWDVEAVRKVEVDRQSSEASGDIHCRKCHAPNGRSAKFCDRCGAAL
jgi:hypothetical protein